MGTSLWIVPDEEDTERLKTIMRARQNEQHNFPSSYPTFQPHVTLASFPSTSTPPTSAIRAAMAPVTQQGLDLGVKFQSVDIGLHFFRSVYIAITPTPGVLALHEAIHTKLGIEPKTPSYPHVSLCYIDDEDARKGERERFLEELEKEGRIRDESRGGVSLRCGEGNDTVWMAEYQPKEVWIAECDGPVESWKIIDKISFA